MKTRSVDIAHLAMQEFTRLIVMAFIIAPVVHASIASKAYASGDRSKINILFQKCAISSRAACVVDGDTIWLDGQKIRIADIDTPEVSEPKCSSERVLGNRATERMLELINDVSFEIEAWPGRDSDRYGRKLRVLIRDGWSLGDILVSEGLARTWSGRREPWC